jgi:NitT/TauT family transport system substrate-binding protein
VALAFRRGEVDAAAHWEPNIQMMAGESGTKTKTLTAPGLHIVSMILVGELDFVRKKPAVVERVLRALLRAERYAKEQPANTKALMASNYTMAQSGIDFVWPLYNFHVSLEQPLLFILENAARWEIGLMPPEKRPAVPNYLDFIYLDGLKTVKPEAVTIIY